MFGWLLFGTTTEFFYKPPVLPKEILKPYHKKRKNKNGKRGHKKSVTQTTTKR